MVTRQPRGGESWQQLGVSKPVESGSGILQHLPRFDLLGADTVGGGLPFSPPTGSGRDGLRVGMQQASVTVRAMFGKVLGEAGAGTSPS